MAFRSDSVAGVRFLAAVHEGRGIKPAARSVGIHSWTGYRLLREAFLTLRSNGLDAEAAQAELGCFTAKAQVWEKEFLAGLGDGRHHLRVRVEVEDIFWGSLRRGWLVVDVQCACRCLAINGLPVARGPIHRSTRFR